MKFALKSKRVIIQNTVSEAVITVDGEKISGVHDYNFKPDCDSEDYGNLIIIPGLTDTHVHINEPGREEWEGFETATKAAIAGGITVLVDMPLNSSPVTVSKNSLISKINSSENKLYCDTGFYGGLIPANANELSELTELIESGVFGLKAFMTESGIDEFPLVNETDLRNSLNNLVKYYSAGKSGNQKQIPLLVHAEINSGNIISNIYSAYSFRSFHDSRPAEMEYNAVKLLIKLCREFDYHIHIVHISTAPAVELIRKAKREGLPLTVETCPHYLYFSTEEIPDTDTRFKCTPPLRDADNREKLWEAVADGTIDFIVSDHSPCNPCLKYTEEGNFEKAWGGISGLQFGLSVINTEAEKRGISISRVADLMSGKTAEFAGQNKRRGRIEKGFDADIVVFDPDKKIVIEEKNIYHRHKVTPYLGREFHGSVECTYLRGKKVFENGEIKSGASGRVLLRK